MKPVHAKPGLYTYFYFELKEIALKHGYNLVIHGSMNRDMDLIAVPWAETVLPHGPMIQEFADFLGGYIMQLHEGKLCNILYQGRTAYVINLNRDLDKDKKDKAYYIDISVTPRPPHEKPLNKNHMNEELKNLGKSGKDKVTGFTGIIIGVAYYLTGYHQYGLVPQSLKPDGSTIDAHWFDVDRVEIVGAGIAAADVSSEAAPGGPQHDSPGRQG